MSWYADRNTLAWKVVKIAQEILAVSLRRHEARVAAFSRNALAGQQALSAQGVDNPRPARRSA
jgi:hypothetical protein